MVSSTDLFHMMDPSGAPQNVNFDEAVSTFDDRYGIAGILAYGGMYSNGVISVTLTVQNTWYEIDGATAWITGVLEECTFTDPYIQVGNDGTYLVNWNLSLSIGTANQGIGGGIMVDQTTIQNPGQARTYFLNANRNLDMGGTAQIALTANQKISLACRNITSAAKVISVQKGNLTIYRMGP